MLWTACSGQHDAVADASCCRWHDAVDGMMHDDAPCMMLWPAQIASTPAERRGPQKQPQSPPLFPPSFSPVRVELEDDGAILDRVLLGKRGDLLHRQHVHAVRL